VYSTKNAARSAAAGITFAPELFLVSAQKTWNGTPCLIVFRSRWYIIHVPWLGRHDGLLALFLGGSYQFLFLFSSRSDGLLASQDFMINTAPLLIALGVLGLFALWSSYISVGFDVNKTLSNDFHFGGLIRFLIVGTGPLFFYAVGLRNFISLVSFVGSILLALEAFLIIGMWWRCRRRSKEISAREYISPLAIAVTALTFLVAFVAKVSGW